MARSKRERLQDILQGIRDSGPYNSFDDAFRAVECVFEEVEEAAETLDRMHPPGLDYEQPSRSSHVRVFRQRGHWTLFGSNGSVRIERISGTVELDLPGCDGRTVDMLSAKFGQL
jgi:hypothetical protein